jgi:predicted unusual protein kinase regulating ubiquinone biosynthesis (AarF/ABC1/UbiB family)
MTDDEEKIPTSRIARTAKLGTLAAGQALRQASTVATNVVRSPEQREAALERRNLEAAEQLVAALGTMKGAAMKIGQVLSFLDVGIVPPEHLDEFQAKLAALRDSAPKVSWRQMRKVIEEELDGPIEETFAEFNPDAVAAASIGQVYKATLHDGRAVAVKVQYPKVGDAVRADLQNLGLLLRIVKRIAPGVNPATVGAEIRERVEEELDYELEAANQRSLARLYRGHPFIAIPDVISGLSSERVLVSEFVDGASFEAMRELDQEQRDRIGEIIFRFYIEGRYRHLQFSGDPHPGNCRLLPDGRLAFLDFGLFKKVSAENIEIERGIVRATIEGDGEEIIRLGTEAGMFVHPEEFKPEDVLAHFRASSYWYTVDREITARQDDATSVMMDLSDPRSEYFDQLRRESAPSDHLLGIRVEVMTLALLAQLRARGNFYRIAREWLYDDPPATELGRLEAEFSRGRR